MKTSQRIFSRALIGLAFLPLGASAQTVMQTEFPEGAVAMAPEALSAKVGGKVFRIKFADGSAARVDHKANGYAFLDMSSGFRDSGKWRVDGTKFCVEWQKASSGCSEARLKGDTVFVKRISNGEIISLSSE